MNEVGPFGAIAALLGVVMTAAYMAGVVHRQRATVAGLGPDSLLVAVVYLGGLYLLFTMR